MPLNNPDAAAARIASGSYAGNDSVNRAIPHGMSGTPKIVLIQAVGGDTLHRIVGANIHYQQATLGGDLAVTTIDSTNFYVGNATSYGQSANATGLTYNWVTLL